MSKQQLLQLLWFVFGRILLGLFVVFVMEISFVDFVLDYWLYLLIVSFSYFYYYSIQYEPDKKYELIRNVLIYGNIYLFLHVFFRPQLNISHQLFVLLGLIILGVWWVTKSGTKWKYLFQVIGGIFSFFILISGMFYFYPESPDIEGFLKNKHDEVKVLGLDNQVEKKDAYIKITNLRGSDDFNIVPGFSKILSENVKISYPSLKAQRDENLVLITSYGCLIWIFPQSEIQVEFQGNDLKKISKINGKIGFLSGVFDSFLEFSGEMENLTQDQQDWLVLVQNSYKNELVSYLKNQISESKISWANNTIMYNIDGKIIRLLARLFPVSFGENLHNYNEFQRYFARLNEGSDLGRYEMKQGSGWSLSEMWGSMKDNMNIGKTNIYGRFKKPKKE